MCMLRTGGLRAASAAVLGVLVLAGSGPALAEGAGAGILGSPHDFKTDFWNFRTEICRVCHAPHNRERNDTLFREGLLWNHRLSAVSYVMYDADHSPTLDNAQDPQPTGITKLCLGCHDGTVAVDSFGTKAPDDSGNVFMADINPSYRHPGASIPRVAGVLDLRGTHPISTVYDDGVDAGLYPKTNTIGFSGTIADVLEGDKVQCSTCHDVHDEEAIAGTHLLRASNREPPSGLCLTCHNKNVGKAAR